MTATSDAPAAANRLAALAADVAAAGALSRAVDDQLAAGVARAGDPSVPAAVGPPPVGGDAGTQHGPRVIVAADSGMAATGDARQRAHVADLITRMDARTPRSKAATQRARGVLSDSRAVVGFRTSTKELLYPLAARHAAGAQLTDVDGNTYTDITMGFGALLLGHEPEPVRAAVAAHLADGLRLGPRSEDTAEVAALLAELTGMERVAFAVSGTEANSAALRLARAATGRERVVMFRGSYHGHIDTVLGRPGGRRDDPHQAVPVSRGIPQSAVADVTVLEYGSDEALTVIDQLGPQLAAVLVEPVQSRRPGLQPAAFMARLREITTRHGVVLVFDEMLTGLRPHPGGAQGFFGVRADLATYGKALGGGYPIGAIAGSAAVMDGVDGGFWRFGDDSRPERETTFFGGTYLQHPLTMAASRAVLTHLREQGPALQDGLNRRTDALAADLNAFFTDEAFPLRVEHFGSMWRLTPRADIDLLYPHLLLRGLYVWEWRSFYLSTAHTDTQLEHIRDAVRGSLRELREHGYFPDRRPATRPVARPAATPAPRPAPDLSIAFFGDYPAEGSPSDGDRYGLITETARFADTHDFHAVWLPERHFHSFGGVFPNPAVLGAALAVQTDRIRINAGSVVLPLHDPVRVAEEWSVVDNLSGGRVGLGCATGWHARDFALAPDRFADRRDIAFAHLDQVRRLWRGETLTRRSGEGADVEVAMFPRPVQSQPPMSLATTGRRESWEAAARHDLGVLTNLMRQGVDELAEHITAYRAARAAAGLDPDAGRVTVLLHTHLDADGDRARDRARGPMAAYLRSSMSVRAGASAGGGSAQDLAAATDADLAYLLGRAYDRYCAERALIGSPQEAAETVERLRRAGVDEIAALVDFGVAAPDLRRGLDQLDVLRRRTRDVPGTVTGDAPDTTPTPTPPPSPLAPPSLPSLPSPDSTGERSAPATRAQRDVWLAAGLAPPGSYNEVQAVRLRGPLDVAALRRAVDALVARHDGLRTVFRTVGDELRQVVLPSVTVGLAVEDVTGPDPDAAIAAAVHAESERPYDLATGPLLHPRLLRLGPDDQVLLIGQHHLVTDGHSARILAADLTEFYTAATAQRPPRFARPAGSALDLPAHRDDPTGAQWWRTHLGEHARPVRLPVTAGPVGPGPTGDATALLWAPDRLRALQRWSGRHGATLFAALLTAWQVVLRRFSGQDDIVVGSTFEGRDEAARDVIGFCAVLRPLRAHLDDDTDLLAALHTARDTLQAAARHQHADLTGLAAPHRDPTGRVRPLAAVSIDLDAEVLSRIDLPGLSAEPIAHATTSAPVELSLMAVRERGGLRLGLRFDTARHHPAVARRLLDHLVLVLDAMIDGGDTPGRVGDLPLLAAGERDELARLGDGGPPAAAPGALRLAHVDDRPRVYVDGAPAWSGRDLDRAADRLAARLTALGVARGDVVAVAAAKGPVWLAALLGVLRVGAVQATLDLAQPVGRLAAICTEARPAVLIVDEYAPDGLPTGLPRVSATEFGSGDSAADPADAPAVGSAAAVAVTAADPAALVHTSGSTGGPKGTVLEHGNLTTLLAHHTRTVAATAADRVAWYSSAGFDISLLDVGTALVTGASLHVVPDAVRLDPPALRAWLAEQAITILFLPTPIAEAMLDGEWPDTLRVLLTGGERLRARPSADARFTFHNLYAPSECTVYALIHPVAADGTGDPALGRPTPGTRLVVRDPAGRPVAPGVVGELHIGGAQVGRGYRGDPVQTARRFRTDTDGTRWFRTGDRVRWLPDGDLLFVDRADGQVQIRGVRVEPAEVEAAVRTLDGVAQVRVFGEVDAAGAELLHCAVVPAADLGTDLSGVGGAAAAGDRPSAAAEREQRWRAALSRLLPRTMIPQRWTVHDAPPVTPQGKWDPTADPTALRPVAPTPTPPGGPDGIDADQDRLAERVRGLFRAVLELPDGAALADDAAFFDLGGHSLSAMRLLNRIREDFADRPGAALPMVEFFADPTIRAVLVRLGGDGDGGADGGADGGGVPGRVRGEL